MVKKKSVFDIYSKDEIEEGRESYLLMQKEGREAFDKWYPRATLLINDEASDELQRISFPIGILVGNFVADLSEVEDEDGTAFMKQLTRVAYTMASCCFAVGYYAARAEVKD